MKRLQIITVSQSNKCSLGVLIDVYTGLPVILTLELPEFLNTQNISRIPRGMIFKCEPREYDGKRAFGILNVPNRSGVLIHIANKPSQLLGCIATGSEFGELSGEYGVLNSGKAMKKLYEYVDNSEFEILT